MGSSLQRAAVSPPFDTLATAYKAWGHSLVFEADTTCRWCSCRDASRDARIFILMGRCCSVWHVAGEAERGWLQAPAWQKPTTPLGMVGSVGGAMGLSEKPKARGEK